MSKSVHEAEAAKLPQAHPGDDWVALARLPENNSDTGRRIEPERLLVYFNSKVHFSRHGLGWTRLRRVTIPAKDNGGVFASSLATCTSIGTATCIDRDWMANLISATPVITELGSGAFRLAQIAQALESLESIPLRNFSGYSRLHGWEHCCISHPDYGFCYVPKALATSLVQADAEMDESLRFTHQLFDVLATKHQLLRELGMSNAIALDHRLIANTLEMREVR